MTNIVDVKRSISIDAKMDVWVNLPTTKGVCPIAGIASLNKDIFFFFKPTWLPTSPVNMAI